MPTNFANAKIYAIRSNQTEQIYIGSTCQPLYKRFHQHKKLDCSSREILVFDDCYIELLEEFPCVNKMQLNRREGELIRLHNCINKRIAGRTLAEHYQDNKTEILEKAKLYYVDNKTEKKQYYQEHKQEIKENRHQKYNCFCTGKYTNNGKSHHFKTTKHLTFINSLETTTV